MIKPQEAVACLVLSAICIVWKGFALTILWDWFVTPIFGLPALALAPAVGLAVVVSLLTRQHIWRERDERQRVQQIVDSFSFALALPTVAIAVGFIAKQCM